MDKVEVRLDPAMPAKRCIASLTAAVKACRIPLEKPNSVVVQKSLEGDGAVYEIYFAVADSDTPPSAKTELYGEIQRHLRHDGISLSVKGLSNIIPAPVPTIADLLAHSDLFGGVAKEGREVLAGHLSEVHLNPGDHLITQDEPARALFVLASGTVHITRKHAHGSRVVHRMGPGGTLGAIGLITGTGYAASAVAMTPVRAYRLDKDGIMAAIALRPELSGELEAMAHKGQAALAEDATADDDHKRDHPEMLLAKVRHFLDRLRENPGL